MEHNVTDPIDRRSREGRRITREEQQRLYKREYMRAYMRTRTQRRAADPVTREQQREAWREAQRQRTAPPGHAST